MFDGPAGKTCPTLGTGSLKHPMLSPGILKVIFILCMDDSSLICVILTHNDSLTIICAFIQLNCELFHFKAWSISLESLVDTCSSAMVTYTRLNIKHCPLARGK